MLTGFHACDDLYFERMQDGSVRVKRENPPGSGQLTMCVELTAEVWASVVASMSLRGECGARFYEALEFHQRAAL